MTAGIAHQSVDTAVDATQCSIVRGRTGVVDDRIDELARSLRFVIDFDVLRIVELLLNRIHCHIRRLLHLCDHHSAERESPFKRQDIHPRQMRVRRGVPCRQLVEQMADPPHHDHREYRCRQHQDDQADSDGYNPPFDRLLDHRSGELLEALGECVGNDIPRTRVCCGIIQRERSPTS